MASDFSWVSLVMQKFLHSISTTECSTELCVGPVGTKWYGAILDVMFIILNGASVLPRTLTNVC
jgi:hypothetical protein